MAKKFHIETRSEPAVFTLIGISCHIKDYRLSFLLNHELELGFGKLEDFVVTMAATGEPDSFSFYFCRDEDQFNTYYLLSNRGQESLLVTELKQADFLLLVEGPFKKTQLDALLASIKKIQQVLTCFEIKFSTIKNFENLLTDLELHLMNIKKESKIRYISPKK
ncbi:MAG: IPExxxVDY family protein [bacterium]